MKEPQLESGQLQEAAELSSSKQDSIPATDHPKDAPSSDPKPDPDAWIQVEKRHRQTSGKSKAGVQRRHAAQKSDGFLSGCTFTS